MFLEDELGLKHGEKVGLDERLLAIEQLPQIAKILNLSLSWKQSLNLHGPDGTEVTVEGEGEKLEAVTPILEGSIPWTFPRISPEHLRAMIRDLIPCNEGTGYLNPSPWEREISSARVARLAPGEVGTDKPEERETGQHKLETGLYNVYFHYLNPLYISSIGPRESFSVTSFMVSIQGSSVSYTLVSREPFVMSFEHGNVKLDREVKVTKSTSWKEAKPHRLAWDVMNPVLDLDCKPKFKVSLFRIEPSSVVPVFLKYDGGINMGLLNMDDRPVISNIYLAARITSASITDPRSMVEEGMEPEFDRIRVPIRRWGYLSIHLEVKRLLEGLLKRKIISS